MPLVKRLTNVSNLIYHVWYTLQGMPLGKRLTNVKTPYFSCLVYPTGYASWQKANECNEHLISHFWCTLQGMPLVKRITNISTPYLSCLVYPTGYATCKKAIKHINTLFIMFGVPYRVCLLGKG